MLIEHRTDNHAAFTKHSCGQSMKDTSRGAAQTYSRIAMDDTLCREGCCRIVGMQHGTDTLTTAAIRTFFEFHTRIFKALCIAFEGDTSHGTGLHAGTTTTTVFHILHRFTLSFSLSGYSPPAHAA